MADFNGFQIGIGADVTVLETQLQKAQNLLKQFEAAAKKATDIGEINYLNNQIKGLNSTIGTLHQEMNKVGKPAGDATQSLINFSRIAQDAPYGIIGIANNLNPMLESFERLSKTEGGTKKALAAMAEGLMGPAGIGVALGIVSSLAVTFSKQISEYFKGATSDLDAFIAKINKVKEDLYGIAGKTESKQFKGEILVGIIGSDASLAARKNALQMLKDLYSQSDAIKKLTIDSDNQTLIVALNNASKQFKVTEDEKNNNTQLETAYTERRKILAKQNIELKALAEAKEVIDRYGEKTIGGKTESREQQKADIIKKYASDLAGVNITIIEFEKNAVKLNTTLSEFNKVDNKKENKVSDLAKAMEDFNREILRGENELKAGKLFAESGKDSFALNQLNAINKAIKVIAGISGPEAQATITKLLAQESAIYTKYYGGKPRAITDVSTVEAYKPPIGSMPIDIRNFVTTGEKQLDPKRTAIELIALDKEVSGQFEINNKKRSEATLKEISKQQQAFEAFGNTIANEVTGAIMGMYDAMQHGENPMKALSDMMSRLAEELAATAIKAAILSAILSTLGGGGGAAGVVAANGGTAATGFFSIFKQLLGLGVTKNAVGGITNGPSLGLIGEAGPEAIMPLSKLSSFLNTSFNAGAMSGGSAGSSGQFVLRGQDLLLAVNRTQKASNLKGQSISLA
jgi:hypothetical protein